MTVNSTVSSAIYVGDGTSTVFQVPFYFLADTHLSVTSVNTDTLATSQLVLNTDYSVAGAGIQSGGAITMLTGAPASNIKILIFRDVPIDQQVDYTPNDKFPAEVTEQALDKITMILQEISTKESSSIHYPLSDFGVDGTLPSAPNRASKVLAFDDLGNQTLVPLPASVGAGDLKNEAWTAGIDFVAGTSNSVTLSRAYGSKADLGTVVMASVPQDPNTYSLAADGITLQFNAVIPAYVDRIWCYGGTTLSLNTPADESVTDAKVAPGSKLWNRINDTIMLDDGFGIAGDGVHDDSVAFQTAINYALFVGKKLRMPAGQFLCNSALVANGKFSLLGEGNESELIFPTNGGLKVIIPDQFHSTHLRDFVVKGGGLGTGNSAIKLTSGATAIPNPANTELSDITNINIYGSDGMGNSKYFPCQVEIEFVSNVNLVNVMGTGTNALQGRGLLIHGSNALPPNVFNCTGCTFNFLLVGTEYGDWVQGLTLSQCNFTGCNFGLNTAPNLNVLVQLAINNSQFNCLTAGVNLNTEIPDLLITGNLFFVPGPSSGAAIGVNLPRTGRYTITGNSFTGYNTFANSDGIVVNTNNGSGVITGNSFDALGTGVVLQAPSSGNNVQSNAYRTVTTPVSDSGTGNTVGGGSH